MGDKFGVWKRQKSKTIYFDFSMLAVSSEHHGITNAAQVQSPSTLPAIIQTSESLISDLWLFQSPLAAQVNLTPQIEGKKRRKQGDSPTPHA